MFDRNADKRIIIIVGGYIRKDVYETADKWLDEVGAGYSRHIYPYNSEGYQLFVISNTPIDDHEIVDATFNGSFCEEEEDIHFDEIDEYHHRTRGGVAKFTGPNYGGEWYTAGNIQGYDDESDERYEC